MRSVIVKGEYGLGNRVLCLLSALLFAKLSRRSIHIDWRDGHYAERGINAFPKLFRLQGIPEAFAHPSSESIDPPLWRGRLEQTVSELIGRHGLGHMGACPFLGRLLSTDVRTLERSEECLVVSSAVPFIERLHVHFTGAWARIGRMAEDEILRALWHEHLATQPVVMRYAQTLRETWPEVPVIGVHVRHTDRRVSLPALRRALESLRRRIPSAHVFLATDSAPVEQDFASRFPDLLKAPKWLPVSGPIHTPGPGCSDRVAMARQALVDLHLLASCDYAVINSESTFSRLVSLLWTRDRDRLVDTATWAWLPDRTRYSLRRALTWMRWGLQLHRLGMPLGSR